MSAEFAAPSPLFVEMDLGGAVQWDFQHGIRVSIEAPVGEHSEKPEAFYDVVRAASYPTAGFYGEAFQRIEREDFANLFVDREALVTAAE